MTIGVTEEHTALAEMVRRWAQRHAPAEVTRAALEDREPVELWTSLAEQGLLAIHVPESSGGAGASPVELAIVAEELGRALAVGAFLPTVVTSLLLSRASGSDGSHVAALAAGTATAAVASPAQRVAGRRDGDALRVSGTVRPVLGAPDADLLMLSADVEGEAGQWFVVRADVAEVRRLPSLDPARPLGEIVLDDVALSSDDLVDLDDDTVLHTWLVLAAAEATGIAGWCLDTATEYAKVREQFGRPIGQFQAVKHRCADMLAGVEQARAAVWDAARALDVPGEGALAAAVAGAVALDAAVDNAKDCIQILGGIGFTWEHDAHRYLRRAVTLRQLLGPTSAWRSAAARHASGGTRRALTVEVDTPDVAALHDEIAQLLATLPDDEAQRRRAIADAGLIQPHWPAPWGRGASPAEQLVIDAAFLAAGVERPDLVIGGWVLPTLIAHGTQEQQERFVRPTLHGEIVWCQLFSEPGAGSDLAALQTKAVRADGGWLLSGQKVWTSVAQKSDWGLCLARTDTAAPKHKGITCFVVDMRAAGLEIKPLRELTGRAMFNEVFLNDVFVPDDQVVGEVNNGWRAGRTTLANERVAMSSGSTMGVGVEGVLRAAGSDPDPVTLERVGRLVCEGQVLAVLGLRTTLRRLGGMDPGAGSSVRKLVGMQHAQDCAELLLELLGPEGATSDGAAERVTYGFLQSRCLTIAGGTTEVQRNVIAERILGLPRDDQG